MILLALGSNITGPWGTPQQTVLRAIDALPSHGVQVLSRSSLIITVPMGPANQPDYVNAVVAVRTGKSPDALMRTLHAIERDAGRVRRLRWGPRTLDLDLIDYNGQRRTARHLKQLALPHPGIAQRDFVLRPLAEIAPRWRHPLTGASVTFMLRKLYRLKRT